MSLLERSPSITWGAADPETAAADPPDARAAALRRPVFPAAGPLTRPHLFAGLAVVGLVVAAALLAPLLAPAPPDLVAPALRLQAPSLAHPFGTDPFGRDLFSRVLYGARIALLTALGALLVSAVPGTLFGMLAGYHRGWLEQVISRGMDAWLAFPGLLLAIVLVARLGPSLSATAVALGIVGIPWYYRTARSGTLSVRQAAYVEAAECIGAASGRVLMRHILPNLTSPLVVLSTLRLGTVLLA